MLFVGVSTSAFAQLKDVDASTNQHLGEVKVTQILKATNEWDGSPLPPYPLKNPEINEDLLNKFLINILEEKESLNILNEDIVPYKAMNYEDPDAFVLAGFVSGVNQKNYF